MAKKQMNSPMRICDPIRGTKFWAQTLGLIFTYLRHHLSVCGARKRRQSNLFARGA